MELAETPAPVFCGVDWAEDHHDIVLVNAAGQQLAKQRITDDAAGFAQLSAVLSEHGDTEQNWIPVAIETSRGLLVACLRATGRRVFAINPLAVARYRDRHSVARKKSDAIDAAALADIWRTDMAAHRPLPADSEPHAWAHAPGRRHAEVMRERRAYPSVPSDARWELIEPVLSAWRFERRGRALDFGRPPRHDLREIMNAILYVDRTGCQWAYLPHDFPPRQSVYGYFAKWQKDGIFAQPGGLLRELVRQQEGHGKHPSARVIDAQSVKTSTSVPATSQGIDAGKKIVGRKRSIITDTLGLLLAALVTAAGVQDSTAGRTLLEQAAADHPGLRKVWVDGGYRKHFIEHAAALGIDLEIVQRAAGTRDFTPIPKRWAVERTYGWLMLHCRLARDYETHPHRSEAMIHLAMTDLMSRRLTGENTISWRDPASPHQSRIQG